MKRILLVALLLLASALVVVKTTGQNNADANSTDKWEYLVVARPSSTNFSPTGNDRMRKESGGFGIEGFVLEQHLDRLGTRGWELVMVGGPPADPVYYFKRRKQG